MAQVEVRRLGCDDLADVDAWLTLFGEAFEDPGAYGAARPDAAYLRELLGDQTFVALAATTGGRIVGALAAYELRKFEQARSEFYIYDLAVDVAHRRHGIATGLIAALKPIARARGGHAIFVQADHVDPPAIALYSKLGTREDVLHFDIAVD